MNMGLKNWVSAGSIGGKIKKLRTYRNLTQKELGLLCDFPTTTAQSRIRQYESNQKSPKESGIDKLADALNVCKESFFETDLTFETQAIHALFDIEDFHGLRPVKIGEHIYLDFCGTTNYGKKVDYLDHSSFLNKWYNMREKTTPVKNDTPEELTRKQKEYDLWRYEYPLNEAKEFSKQLHLQMKKERLEEELKKINEELNSSEN